VPKLFIPEKVLIKSIKTGLKIRKIGTLENILKTVEKWIAEDVYLSEKIKAKYNFAAKVSAHEALKRQVNFNKDKK
jgi:hypothetical protein